MLRAFVLILGLVVIAFGGVCIALCDVAAPGIEALIVGFVLAGGVALERWRYRPLDRQRPGPGWDATGERYVDPETGRHVTVYHNPTTGERRYVTS